MSKALFTVAWLSCYAGTLTGQDSLRLRYGPGDATMRVATESQETWTLMRFPGLADSVTGEATTFVAESRRRVESLQGATIVETKYDSARVRFRVGGLAWQTVQFDPAALGSERELIDSTMVRSPMAATAGELTDVSLVRGLRRLLSLMLPDNAVRAGDGWDSVVDLPYTIPLLADSTVLLTTRLSGEAEAVVDSLVARRTDTLAYITVSARLDSRMVPSDFPLGDGRAPVEVWGAARASLLWASGWRSWVSGAMAARFHHRIEAPSASGLPDPRLVVQMTTRFRLR